MSNPNNILVNWKVNTDEVAKSRDLLNQTQQAADKYTTAATKGGNESAKAFGKTATSVDDMRLRLKELKAIMDTLPLTATKRLAQYSAEYKKLDAEIRKVTKDLYEQDKATKNLGNSTQGAVKQFGQLFTAIKLIIGAGLLRQAVSTSLEMAKLSGNVEGVKRAFTRAFPDAQLLMSDLQRATHGTVTEFELMQRTLQATNLGVAVESLPVLFEFAAARAQQTGESVDYLVDSIVRGIGRKSILVLDNLGLSATRLREQFNGASLASQSVADVTRGVAEIAKVELAKMGGYAETAATKVDQLSVSWKGLGQQISELATQDGGLIEFFKSYTDSFALLFEAINKNISVEELSIQKQREHNAEFSAGLFFQTAFTKSKEENIKVLDAEIQRITKSIGSWVRFRDEMEKNNKVAQDEIAIKKLSFGVNQDEIIALGQEIKFRQDLINVKKEETLEDQEVLKLLLLRLAAMKEIEKVAETLGLIAAKEAEISDVSDKLKAAKSTTEINKLNNSLATLNGELTDLKAFGTTKQLLQVNGEIKLVPVVAQGSLKKLEADLKAEPLFKEGVVIPVTIGGEFVENKGIATRGATDQLQAAIDEMIRSMPDGITKPVKIELKPEFIPSEWDLIAEEFAENWKEITSIGINSTADIINASIQAEADAYDAKINQSKQYYDRLIEMAGDNENAKSRLRLRAQKEEQKLRREAFEADKRARRGQAVINGAAGIIRAFATLDFYEALAASIVIAGETAAQIAVINKQQPRFAKGVIDLKGPGTKTSDSINAKLSRHESVMTGDETASSGGILRDIRAGKLNDRKLAKQLDSAVLRGARTTKDGVRYVGMDDKRIVKEIQDLKNSQPDYKEMNGMLYRTRKKGQAYKQWVRTRAMG